MKGSGLVGSGKFFFMMGNAVFFYKSILIPQ
jgi:hypothetical protein